jgi:hypothetical protein
MCGRSLDTGLPLLERVMKPNILDPKWKYVPASQTNIAATFKRIRKEMEKQKEASNVTTFRKAK